eukprot:TRINITY_DN10892_c0_g1_i1.p1 TRINITY_DN10892_c0_g1~~TRINITY_DN10892_c0_g1_i1.p1  ORF type:complete len:563 (-),score=106.72 TRINITY_DN10892_c0_g1_i1:68-1756(-)
MSQGATLQQDLGLPDVDQSPPLSRAAFFGRVETLRRLIQEADRSAESKRGRPDGEHGDSGDSAGDLCLTSFVNAQDAWGMTAAHWAIVGEQSDSLAALIDCARGLDLNARDSWGMTPLHYACGRYFRSAGDITRLISAGADPNALNTARSAPLHAAALLARVSAFPPLLRAGADHTLRDADGRTPTMLARDDATRDAIAASASEVRAATTLASLVNVPSISEFLSRVQQPDQPHAEFWGFVQTDRHKQLQKIITSVDGPALNAKDCFGFSPLHWAVANASENLVDLLLSHGAHVTHEVDCCITVLHLAVLTKSYACAKRILEIPNARSLFTEICSIDNHNPLTLAASLEDKKMVTLLLASGFERSTPGGTGLTAVALAKSKDVIDLINSFDIEEYERSRIDAIKFSCSACGKKVEIKWCAKCHTACYCSRECQVQDWPQHKQRCNSVVFVPASEVFPSGKTRMETNDAETNPTDGIYEFIVKIQSPIVSGVPPEMIHNVQMYAPLVYNQSKRLNFRVLTEGNAKRILKNMGTDKKIYCYAHLSHDMTGVVVTPEKRAPGQKW